MPSWSSFWKTGCTQTKRRHVRGGLRNCKHGLRWLLGIRIFLRALAGLTPGSVLSPSPPCLLCRMRRAASPCLACLAGLAALRVPLLSRLLRCLSALPACVGPGGFGARPPLDSSASAEGLLAGSPRSPALLSFVACVSLGSAVSAHLRSFSIEKVPRGSCRKQRLYRRS